MNELVYLPDGRIAGSIRGTTFVKSAWSSRHLLRYPPAWAIDLGIFAQLEARGVNLVRVNDKDTGNTYEASLDTFKRYGLRIDRGHGEQIALPLAHWRVNSNRGQAEREQERRTTVQLALFAEEAA